MAHIYLGIDIGGTKINSVLLEEGRVLWQKKEKTAKDSRTDFLRVLDDMVREGISKQRIAGIGIGMPAPTPLFSSKAHIVYPAHLPCLRGFDLPKYAEKKYGLPVRMLNDAQSFTWGEYVYGAGKGSENCVGVTLGTGIGGGWVVGGKIYTGYTGSAMEIGHMPLGDTLEFEELAASQLLRRRSSVDPVMMQAMADNGDPEALGLYKELGVNLGRGLAAIVNVLDPQVIVLGGGVMHSRKYFLPIARKEMARHIFSKKAKRVKVVPAKLGDDAGAIGAASLFSIASPAE